MLGFNPVITKMEENGNQIRPDDMSSGEERSNHNIVNSSAMVTGVSNKNSTNNGTADLAREHSCPFGELFF